MRPRRSATTASSGSGTSQPESARTPIGWPGPLAVPGRALRNSAGRLALLAGAEAGVLLAPERGQVVDPRGGGVDPDQAGVEPGGQPKGPVQVAGEHRGDQAVADPVGDPH